MNNLSGEIKSIKTNGGLSLVNIEVAHILITAIVIDTPETVTYLKLGNKINVIFKETEVIVGKGNNHPISLQNKFTGKVQIIERGVLLSRLTLNTVAGTIISVITTNAVDQLGLEAGSEVTAMIKTNEIMLSE